ncbi:hypothetical protein [Paraburkholderia sp.]|uniref:hypothetical protein n=1 Tax=Paraburkholderia sp. TaxID=1926495 RepID=UPI00286F6FE9|nr:hypothetical protein [Paraburkholderia sp.]
MKLKNVFQKIRAWRWPANATVTIALLALLVSGVQLIVTAPLLTGYFISPKVEVDCTSSAPKDEVLAATCFVVNKGNAPATKLEIGMSVQTDQQVAYLPDLVNETISQNNAVLTKNLKIEVDRLLPGESFLIVATPGSNLQKLPPDVADFFTSAGIHEFPMISYVRYAEGVGHMTQHAIRQTAPPKSAPHASP